MLESITGVREMSLFELYFVAWVQESISVACQTAHEKGMLNDFLKAMEKLEKSF